MKELVLRVTNIVKLMLTYVALILFYIYGFLWTRVPRKVSSMRDVLHLFYYSFLRLKPEHVEIVKLTPNELITISRNPCPILKFSLLLGVDTKFTCKVVSETVCRYVLRKLDKSLIFERDYSHIRPYRDGCLERISRK